MGIGLAGREIMGPRSWVVVKQGGGRFSFRPMCEVQFSTNWYCSFVLFCYFYTLAATSHGPPRKVNLATFSLERGQSLLIFPGTGSFPPQRWEMGWRCGVWEWGVGRGC